jgi:hypothetical protein
MRIVGLVFSLLVTLLMAAVTLTYVQGYVGQHRIYVQGRWRSSPDHSPHNNSSHLSDTNPDTGRAATGYPDPYLQRYYSQSEGWTYYALPSYSSGHQSDDH